MAVLRATRGLESGSAYELGTGSLLLGRNPQRCDVVLEHFAVSREHARVDHGETGFYIEDLRSRNGVRINGRKISPGESGRQQLHGGDRIEIAAFEFRFEQDSSSKNVALVSDDEERKPGVVSTLHVGTDSSKTLKRNRKLHTLVNIIQDLSSEFEVERVLSRTVSSLFQAFPQADSGCLLLREEGEFVPVAVQRVDGLDEPVRVSKTILNEVVANRQPVLLGNGLSDDRVAISPRVRELNLCSLMSAPLLDAEGGVFGILQFEVVEGSRPFTAEGDLELLTAVARHLSLVFENSRLEQRIAERTLALARTNRDLEQFANAASHELQAPLQAIHSHCRLLHERYDGQLDADANDYLRSAVAGTERMQRQLDNLSQYSKVATEAHVFSATDLEDVFKDVLHNLQAQVQASGAQVKHDPLPVVSCDAAQMTLLLQHLIGNAIVYRSEAPPEVHLGAEEEDGEWRFSVRDNGIGIDPRHFDRIFETFQRLDNAHERPGSGIGLSICKRIVERHGGEIWVESRPGEGSTFRFTMPRDA